MVCLYLLADCQVNILEASRKSNKKDCDPRTIHSLMRGTKQMRRVRAKIETAKARAGEILPRNFCQSIDVIGYLR